MDAVAEVKSRINIEDVVSEYVQLKRAGRNFKGLSPFTNEKTPSFIVSPEKQIWHDFSSGKGGDVFTFIQEVEGQDFRGALEILARKAGVDLEQFKSGQSSGGGKLKARTLEVLELATKFYQKQLTANRPALEYLIKSRRFSKETVLAWRLGYAPNKTTALAEFLTKKGFTADEMKRAGLVSQSARGARDMFRGRIMVPLADASGQIVGFTARLLADEPNSPKYINTPATIVYDKSRQVFGLHLAKEAIRKTSFVVVVEGNMDVIASWQAGVKNVVASAGTAMTEQHLKALKRFTGDIRLSFDADRAGITATERVIPLAQKTEVSLRIISIEGAKDPDELVQKNPKLWQKAIDQAAYAPDWLIQRYASQEDLQTAAGKRAFTDALLSTIRRLRDPVEQEHYLKKIAELTQTSFQAVQNKFNGPAAQPQQLFKKSKYHPGQLDVVAVEHQRWQDHFLSMVLNQPKLRDLLKDVSSEYFTEGPQRELLEFIKQNPDWPKGSQRQALHLDATEGAVEQRTETYSEYVDGAAEAATRRGSTNLNQQGSSAYSVVEMVQSLQDYVKILMLQFEELYSDLPLKDLQDMAAQLKHRLIDRYVKNEKNKLAAEMRDSNGAELEKLIKKVNELNLLIK